MSAAITAAVVVAGASAYAANQSAKAQSSAARSAADQYSQVSHDLTGQQREALARQLELQQNAYLQQQEAANNATNYAQMTQAPYLQAGNNALAEAMSGIRTSEGLIRPFTAADFKADPGYQFRLTEGQKALDRAAASRGGLYSGRAQKDLAAYNQGQAAQEYQAAYNRFTADQERAYNASNNTWNRLRGIAGMGQQTASGLASGAYDTAGRLGSAAQNYANNSGNLIGSAYNTLSGLALGNAETMGNAQLAAANAQAGQYGAYGRAAGGLANAASSYIQNRYYS